MQIYKRYKLTIEYDGTDYSGWQKQKNAKSIQEEIEKAIFNFSGEEVDVFVAGRTDAGVHARGQVAHFDLQKEVSLYSITSGVNFHLDKRPIRILKTEAVQQDFHARFSARQRIYNYKIINRPVNLALDKNRAWHIKYDFDLEKIREASKLLLGKNDFSSFRSSECQAKSPIKTIDEINFFTLGEEIIFEIKARSFLHHMVRNIVGSLYNVGVGKWEVLDFKECLEAKDRKKAGITAPACGLYLMEVVFE